MSPLGRYLAALILLVMLVGFVTGCAPEHALACECQCADDDAAFTCEQRSELKLPEESQRRQ